MQHLTLPAAPTSARAARRFLNAFCAQQQLADAVVDDAVLLVSELVSNSILHAHSEARVRVAMEGTVLRVEVADDSSDLPRQRRPTSDAIGGRGMAILDELSSSWGATRRTDPPPGKAVWFTITTDPRV